jgi:diacylglycerol kinase
VEPIRVKPDLEKSLAVRFVRSFGYALRGITIAARDRNFRVQFLAGAITIGLSIAVGLTPIEWSLIAGAIAGVLSLEAMNSAVEAAVDLASPEWHETAAKAKDLAAGAVLIGVFGAIAVGGCILGPKLWRLFV